MGGGIALTSLGALAMAVGTAMYVDTVSNCRETPINGQIFRTNCDNAGTKLAGMTTLLVGATGAAFGVPLWIFGAEKVAATPEDQAPKPAAAVVVGPAGATLHVTF